MIVNAISSTTENGLIIAGTPDDFAGSTYANSTTYRDYINANPTLDPTGLFVDLWCEGDEGLADFEEMVSVAQEGCVLDNGGVTIGKRLFGPNLTPRPGQLRTQGGRGQIATGALIQGILAGNVPLLYTGTRGHSNLMVDKRPILQVSVRRIILSQYCC